MHETNLTLEEQQSLSPYNCAAFDLARKNAAPTILPCWLCTSQEAKERARNDVLQLLRGRTGNADLTLEEAEVYVKDALPKVYTVLWQQAELEAKRARAASNPRAFFCG